MSRLNQLTRGGENCRFPLALLVVSSLFVVSGCTEATPDFSEFRSTVLLDGCPDDVSAIADTHESMTDGNVCVVGRIFADEVSPFDANTAMFNLIELPKPGHNHDDPGDCPFCKREMLNAAMATVQFLDDDGQVRKTPANVLLPLSKNQDVVVSGSAKKVGESLVISAQSVHVLNDEEADAFAKMVHAKPATEESTAEESTAEESTAEESEVDAGK